MPHSTFEVVCIMQVSHGDWAMGSGTAGGLQPLGPGTSGAELIGARPAAGRCSRLEDILDPDPEQLRDGEGELQAGVVLAGLDRVHRPARYAEPFGEIALGPAAFGTPFPEIVPHDHR